MADDEKESQPVSAMEFMNRMRICGECPHLNKGIKISRCNLCGCILGLKARSKKEHCPINKW